MDIGVQELVDRVYRGELALPEMQRRYVWPATRVRDLLDSLYRGYPSGTILVWESQDEIETKELAVKSTKTPTTSTKLLLLDGQQRITSLAAIMSGQPVKVRRRRKPIEILFNLGHPEGPPVEVLEVDENDPSGDMEDQEDEQTVERDIQEELRRRTFVVASRALQANPLWVQVTSIFTKTDREILKPLAISSEDGRWDKYSERLQRVRKIADYQYVMQVLDKSLSYEEVTEIFVRVNSLGIKLRGTDLALAQITSRWKGFMKLCEQCAASFREEAGYLLETGLIVRLLVVFATGQSRFKTVGRLNRAALENAWEKTKPGLEFAVNFAKSNTQVESLSLLSSPFLLIPVAVYSHLKKQALSAQEEKALSRWLYVAHMRGHYSGSSETILDADLASLHRTRNLAELTRQLQLHVKQLEVGYDDLVDRGVRNPLFTMLYFVLRQNGAKDWVSGLRLSERHIGRAHKVEYHHIFPKSQLQKAGYDRKKINEIANMAFVGGKANRHILNKLPADYLPNDIIPKRGEEALSSQLVPLDNNLWRIENYEAFLDYRRKQIAQTINSFIEKLG
jgi:hypothetical protein